MMRRKRSFSPFVDGLETRLCLSTVTSGDGWVTTTQDNGDYETDWDNGDVQTGDAAGDSVYDQDRTGIVTVYTASTNTSVATQTDGTVVSTNCTDGSYVVDYFTGDTLTVAADGFNTYTSASTGTVTTGYPGGAQTATQTDGSSVTTYTNGDTRAYDSAGDETFTDAETGTITYTDAGNGTTTSTDSSGNVTVTDSSGNVTVTDSSGNVTVTEVPDEFGNQTVIAYNSSVNLYAKVSTTKNSNGDTTVVATTDDYNSTTSVYSSYYSSGSIEDIVTDYPDGSISSVVFDTSGNTFSTLYSANGDVTTHDSTTTIFTTLRGSDRDRIVTDTTTTITVTTTPSGNVTTYDSSTGSIYTAYESGAWYWQPTSDTSVFSQTLDDGSWLNVYSENGTLSYASFDASSGTTYYSYQDPDPSIGNVQIAYYSDNTFQVTVSPPSSDSVTVEGDDEGIDPMAITLPDDTEYTTATPREAVNPF